VILNLSKMVMTPTYCWFYIFAPNVFENSYQFQFLLDWYDFTCIWVRSTTVILSLKNTGTISTLHKLSTKYWNGETEKLGTQQLNSNAGQTLNPRFIALDDIRGWYSVLLLTSVDDATRLPPAPGNWRLCDCLVKCVSCCFLWLCTHLEDLSYSGIFSTSFWISRGAMSQIGIQPSD